MKPIPQLADYPVPETKELECKIISTMINDSTSIPEIMRNIKPTMLSQKENVDIWNVIMAMYNNREQIELITIMPRVEKKYFVDNIVAVQAEYTISGLQSLISAFLDSYIKRCAYFVSVEALQMTCGGISCTEIADKLGGFKDRVYGEFKDNSAKNTMEIANTLADKLMRGEDIRVATGIRSVDFLTYGGLAGGNLIILAARPSVGKTTIALQIALEVSKRKERAMVFSLEMSNEELVQRMILSTGYITPMDFFSRNFDWASYDRAVGEVTNEHLIINDRANGIDEICQKIRVESQSGNCKLVVIDYLGLIPVTNKRANLASAIGELTQKLKNTAKACNIPILLLCQLNRSSAIENRSPQLTDLRESGAIEQDADMVIMLEKAKDSEGNIQENSIDLWVRKNRNGKCNYDEAIHLVGNSTYSNFYER